MVLQRGADRIDRQRDLPGNQIGQRRSTAAIGNMDDVHATHLALEPLGGEMQERPGTRRAVLQLAGIGLGVGDDLLEISLPRGMCIEGDRRGAHLGDRHEVLENVELRLFRHQVIERKDRRGAEQHGVAVRLGPRRLGGADGAGRAGLVVDDDLLTEQRRHARRVMPGKDIGRAAGGEGDDDPNDAVRVGALRRCRSGDQCQRRKDGERKLGRSHAGRSRKAAQ